MDIDDPCGMDWRMVKYGLECAEPALLESISEELKASHDLIFTDHRTKPEDVVEEVRKTHNRLANLANELEHVRTLLGEMRDAERRETDRLSTI